MADTDHEPRAPLYISPFVFGVSVLAAVGFLNLHDSSWLRARGWPLAYWQISPEGVGTFSVHDAGLNAVIGLLLGLTVGLIVHVLLRLRSVVLPTPPGRFHLSTLIQFAFYAGCAMLCIQQAYAQPTEAGARDVMLYGMLLFIAGHLALMFGLTYRRLSRDKRAAAER